MWPFTKTAPKEDKSLAEPGDDLYALFGITPTTTGGVKLTAESALYVTAVSSAIKVISEAVACLDIHVKEIGADGTETDAPNHPVLSLLRDQANDWTAGHTMIRDLVIDALSDDRGGMAYVNRVGGRPKEIIRYRRAAIGVEFDQNTGEPSFKINNRPIPAANVVHLRAPFGKSPLTLASEAIGTAASLNNHATRLFGRGARPSGVLTFAKGMAEEAVKRSRAAWQSTHEADGETGKTAILFDGAEFKPLTLASTDAQFLENRKFQILEIARAFRVPPSMLFELDRATWSNTEQLGKEFLTYCLEPWLKALEGALRMALFLPGERSRYVIRFDRDDLTRADLNTRSTVINSLIASRVINPNEGRRWLGLQAYDGGDEFANPNIQTSAPPAKEEPNEDD